ncbi:MAG TPA: phosphotransferase [Rhizomicrobium sp.]|jgi:aminoglycoside/choline kinase family phosphotransferase|nr:phosphotransferase [Rhizomicrobium sp.]
MSDRSLAMKDFLARAGWGDAVVSPLPGDASTRHYARLALGERKAMLMDQPQNAEAPTAGPDASEETRRALGYNALARLAGADTARFVAAAQWLRAHGLAAPEIYDADPVSGFVILEDLGDALFAEVLADGGDEKQLYQHAVEVLAKIHASAAPVALAAGKPLFDYDLAAQIAETDLLPEWFLPLALGRKASDEERIEHRRLWRAALSGIGKNRRVFVHRDYHAQNLLWLPQRSGVSRVGLIDFQDAVAGSAAYDLISLIEDARRDVSPALAEAATAHYLATIEAQGARLNEQEFRQEMAVMAAQRNAKIVGIFARLYKRDGRVRYLAFLPRVWAYLERDLGHPALADLRAWYDRVIPKEKRALEIM